MLALAARVALALGLDRLLRWVLGLLLGLIVVALVVVLIVVQTLADVLAVAACGGAVRPVADASVAGASGPSRNRAQPVAAALPTAWACGNPAASAAGGCQWTGTPQ